jgi:hypothetical protein
MDNKPQIESILADRLLVQEINSKLESGQGIIYKSGALKRALRRRQASARRPA